MTSQPGAPGWYPDPSGRGQRYWDGNTWGPPSPDAGTPKKLPRKLWIGIAVVFGIFLIAAISDDGSSNKSASTSSSSSAAAALSAPSSTSFPAASAARDGQFEFRVLGVDRAKSFGGETAKGEFVVVTLHVENTGSDARSFYGGNQKLVDTAGRQYAADGPAMFGETSGDINPGFSIETHMAYDVVPGTAVQGLICHDSMFSGGARLAVVEGGYATN
ncbi:DUF4352 domain-containing protein [Mycobacterium cookii]|uniref:Mpr protein n=1 Tax=Mycobacterium cookii TaxID=1775 RepID=A0A7I7L0Z6_9MYCO|nr:DUF4352 domain-containing protein [Mycobacterium cookii]MCV7333242.1 DUF4352 domain-containing protein [Mycobacterium cookii]BBX47744.1 Mpr protein [Mycobacterium cookii]